MDDFGLVLLGGLGGYLLLKAAEWARGTATGRPEDSRGTISTASEELAALGRAVKSYRAEVSDLSDLVDRRHRAAQKREQRSGGGDGGAASGAVSGGESAGGGGEISTSFPQGESPTSKDAIRAWMLARRGRR